jgi:hypothetical protein
MHPNTHNSRHTTRNALRWSSRIGYRVRRDALPCALGLGAFGSDYMISD